MNFRKTESKDKTLSKVQAQKKAIDVWNRKNKIKILSEQKSSTQQNHNSRIKDVDMLWNSDVDDDEEVSIQDVMSELNRTEMAEAFQKLLKSVPKENHRKWKIIPSNSNVGSHRYSHQLKYHSVPNEINKYHSHQFDMLNKGVANTESHPSGNDGDEKDESDEEIDTNDIHTVEPK
jgi:hypothetical protein